MAKQVQRLTRDAIHYETKRDFSKSQHSKQYKRFLARVTALNTTETSINTYELFLTSADRLLLSKIISLHGLLLVLEHIFLFITANGQASADTDKRRNTVRNQTRSQLVLRPLSAFVQLRNTGQTLDRVVKKPGLGHRGIQKPSLVSIPHVGQTQAEITFLDHKRGYRMTL